MFTPSTKLDAPPEQPLLARIVQHLDAAELFVCGPPKDYEPAKALPAVLAELGEGHDSLPWSQVKVALRQRGCSWAQVTRLHKTLGDFAYEHVPRTESYPTTTPVAFCLPWAVVGVGGNLWRVVRLTEEDCQRALAADVKRKEDEEERRAKAQARRKALDESPSQEPKPPRLLGKIWLPGELFDD